MLRFACSLAMVASFALTAVADIPPPPPEAGFKRVPYEHVVKLAGEVPGYKFFSYRGAVFGDSTIGEELKLGKEKGVVVPGSSSPSVRTGVVAVPDKVMAEVKTTENLAKLLSRDNKDKIPAGVVTHETRGTSRDLKNSDPRSKVENVVTISVDEKAGVKFTVKETPAPANTDGALDDSSRPPLATMLAGIAGALAIAMAGVWYFRGSKSPDAEQTPSK